MTRSSSGRFGHQGTAKPPGCWSGVGGCPPGPGPRRPGKALGEKPVENVRKMGKSQENGTVLAGKCEENVRKMENGTVSREKA